MIGLAIAAMFNESCHRNQTAPSARKQETPIVAVAPAPALVVGPITFFQHSCSKCHGPFGAMYADTFATTGEGKLKADVARMVTGPAQTRLGAAELEALVAFHRSIANDEPFVIVTRMEGSMVEGETTVGARVFVDTPTEHVEAVVDGWKWRAIVGSGASEIAGGSARAEASGRSVSCVLKSGASSHDAPLPRE